MPNLTIKPIIGGNPAIDNRVIVRIIAKILFILYAIESPIRKAFRFLKLLTKNLLTSQI